MKRRKFLKQLGLGASAPLLLNNIPVNSLAANNALTRIASSVDEDNDRVLVLIQLHGGNDGLNTLIPINQYGTYNNLRPNIAISNTGNRKYITLDSTLPEEKQIGLHPDMGGLKSLYDDGRAAIVQAVAYENMNQSHFRSTDIWFMGGDYDDYLGSGWMGRYLNYEYPGYPESYPSSDMPDPLGLEIGNSVSLAFHREEGIPAAISVQNPDQFYNLITNVGVNPPESIENTLYGKELKWIMDIEEKSNQYAGRLKEVYDKGKNAESVIYPETYNQPVTSDRYKKNALASQLKVVARMISGGSKTKIYLVRLGGFDTHAKQVEDYNTSLGNHATLLYYLSSTIKAFLDDLKAQGLSERVMGVTFSEFGRRAASNNSYGTDHGSATPMFVFGDHTIPGVHGTNPDLKDLDKGGNIKHQHDYRQVFTSLLKDWLCASDEAIAASLFSDYVPSRLELVSGAVGIDEPYYSNKPTLFSPWPNPATDVISYEYDILRASEINLSLYGSDGTKLKELVNDYQLPGKYKITDDISSLPKGAYILRLQTNRGVNTAKKIIKH